MGGSDQRVDRVDLSVGVTAAIREMILSGEVRGGERLVETELADRFGTSRGPVRDALATLARTGLVTMASRRGAYVTLLDATDVEELYSLRLALEQVAVSRASKRATPADIALLRAALDQIADAQADGDSRQVVDADMRFHRGIIRLAGHRRLLEAWEAFADQTMLLMTALNHVAPEVQSLIGGHGELLAALEAGEGRAADIALSRHLSQAMESVVRQLSTSVH